MPSFFRALLYLYPTAYRQEFGGEMLSVLGELREEMKERGSLAQLISHVHETGGLILGALREHVRNLGLAPDFSVFPQRRLPMRSDFRFPKSTVTLMGIILIAIMVAIEKAKAIQQSIPPSHTDVGPIQPAYVAILPTFLIALAGICVCSLVLWAVLFAFHRSGIQRLSDLNPSATPQPRSGLFR